jgi:hypothetical protein
MRVHVAAVLAIAILGLPPPPAGADPAGCRKQIVNQLFKFKKIYLKMHVKCLDKQNFLKIEGPCPDAAATAKISATLAKLQDRVAARCTVGDLATLGYSSSCDFDAAATGIEATCAALPASTPAELAACLACWKSAELSEFAATLYASHAGEVCQGAFDATSAACSALDCTTPLPEQRNLGDGGDGLCQKGIGRSGFKHVVKIEKVLEKCGLKGGTRASCLADEKNQTILAALDDKLLTRIKKRCGNRIPAAETPFCCRMGGGNMCIAAATRQDCVDAGGAVQDDKFCGVDDTCSNTPGPGKPFTWWETCPISDTCPGTALASIEDLSACVDTSAEEIADEMLCRQFPSGWPGPGGSPSGAFP